MTMASVMRSMATGTTKARKHEDATKKNPRRSVASGAACQIAANARSAQPIRNKRPPIGVTILGAVAHEVTTDTLVSKEVHGTWPKIDAELASLGPIAVSQPRAGGFLRNGRKQTEGPLVLAEDEPLRPDVPTAVIALVCRAKDQKRPLRVVRTLIGETETPVGTTQLDLSTDRCAQVVDLIPPKMLGAGRYRFVVTVSSDGNELTRGERSLALPEPPAPPVAPAPLAAPSPAPPTGSSS
jgi:hypothetical protein